MTLAKLSIMFGIKANYTNSNIKEPMKRFYSCFLFIYLIENKELLFLEHVWNELLSELVFNKAQF